MAAFRATYRLQLGPGLTFADAAALVPYLRELGVSHLYLSPAFAAREGSTHGYDVVDPTRFSDVLGGEAGFAALAAAARAAGLGLVLDIVPNHMATDDANPYWADPERRARFFDLDPETGRHRRFFDIDHLAGVRQEDPDVFAETHRLALALVADGTVDGLRIDHPDGLADPAGYLAALRAGGAEHVWVEKILDPGEPLREWPVEGTVGYEFLVDVAALFVDPAGEAALTELWTELSGDPRPFAAWAAEAKREQARDDVRARRGVAAASVARGRRGARRRSPRCRSTAPTSAGCRRAEDLRVLRAAGLVEWLGSAPPEFVVRFQQTTPPVMAKGVEDTAFYRYVRLLALNDVGGDPGRFGLGVEAFHAANAERAARFPRGLLVTQTHDTKRSGDVRARIGALAALADEWAGHVRRWRSLPGARAGGAGCGRAVHDLPDARGRVADRPRPAVRLSGQGDARAQGHVELARAGRGARGGRAGVRPRALLARGLPRRLRAVRRARGRRSASSMRCGSSRSSSPSRACPTSTRATSWSTSRSSTPTTGGPSTGRAAGRSWTSSARARRPRAATRASCG